MQPQQLHTEEDPTAESRKHDHIALAFKAQVESAMSDTRFYYEPMLAGHSSEISSPFSFAGKTMKAPLWVSSMTGGTEKAKLINENLARVCGNFGLGMGLGSCRQLLDSDERLHEFAFRQLIGDDAPFYANLGIAQIEKLVKNNELWKIDRMMEKLSADGLFIHVNPFQEWLQPEGDFISVPPVETIAIFLQKSQHNVIVKEVGQGMGPESLKALMQLPLMAIEFAALGGTNFSLLELLRSNEIQMNVYAGLSKIGHSAIEMAEIVNKILDETPEKEIQCQSFILSGGVKNFLDGYYLLKKINANAVYGQASGMLKYAEKSYEELEAYVDLQIKGLALAKTFLKIKR